MDFHGNNPSAINNNNNNNNKSLAYRVSQNDPELRHLYLSSDSLTSLEVTELTQALSNNNTGVNTHLQHVYFRNFKLGGGLQCMERLLLATQGLPNLHSLFFHCTEVPLSILTNVLQQTRQSVTALGLRYCKLRYETMEDYQIFVTQALQQHDNLQDFCVECCEWQPDQEEIAGATTAELDKMSSLLQAISYIPTLQHVECVLTASIPPQRRQQLPSRTLQRLAQIPSLTSLRLRNLWLPQDDVALLCHSFNDNTNNTHHQHRLRKLILSCDLGPTSAAAFGQYLQDPQCQLEYLSLRIDRLLDPHCPQMIAQALAQQQQQQAQAQGGRLQHFHLSGSAASQLSWQAKQAFCDMMETNVSLEFVRLEVSDYALQAQIAFYLQLNHKGRRELFANIHHQQQQQQCQQQQELSPKDETCVWVQALCQNLCDVRALHYFLALHPGLFAMAALSSYHRQHQQVQRQEELQEVGIDYDSDGW